MEVDSNGLEVLGRQQCLDLLATVTFGRVGVTSGALPTVLPVNFLLHEEHVLIRSGAGTKLGAALRNAVVAFEADDFDPLDHSGWSVVVTGVAQAVTDPEELTAVKALPLARWAPAGDDHVIAISTEMVSGRRLDRLRVQELVTTPGSEPSADRPAPPRDVPQFTRRTGGKVPGPSQETAR